MKHRGDKLTGELSLAPAKPRSAASASSPAETSAVPVAGVVADPSVSLVWPSHFGDLTRKIAAPRCERFLAKLAPLWQPSPVEAAVILKLILHGYPLMHIKRALGDELDLKPGDQLDLQQLIYRTARYHHEANEKRSREYERRMNARYRRLRIVK
jgi:hypothetical protein